MAQLFRALCSDSLCSNQGVMTVWTYCKYTIDHIYSFASNKGKKKRKNWLKLQNKKHAVGSKNVRPWENASIALFNNYNNLLLPSFTGRFRWPSHLWWEFRRHCFMGNRLCSSVLSRCLHKSQELQPLDRLDHHRWELKHMFSWMREDFP